MFRKAHTAHLPKSAFTLAEILIVIGVIGIVAAMTIPNLILSVEDKETVARVKKIYSNLSDAYGRSVAKYGPISGGFSGLPCIYM